MLGGIGCKIIALQGDLYLAKEPHLILEFQG